MSDEHYDPPAMADPFKDIRPYRDHEIRPVLERLLDDPEFLASMAAFHVPRLAGRWRGAAARLARLLLRMQVRGVHDVASMQDVIAYYLRRIIRKTTTELTSSGMEYLERGANYLFISNHRDIVMDPAIVNYMLYHADHLTVQIAIGDNLLKKPFASELMRLNKSFIVRRSLKGRELLRSSKQLSGYIHHCVGHGENVWIAQREGRAKDGIDRTDPALLKMLSLGRPDMSLGASLSQLHIVPLAISYEYDPCDDLKARELWEVATTGSHAKTAGSDIQSMVRGMLGNKGRVHLAFGNELIIDSDSEDAIAAQIDRQVIHNYRLRDSNFIALEHLRERGLLDEKLRLDVPGRDIGAGQRQEFADRLARIEPDHQEYMLRNYANPVISRYRQGSPEQTPSGAAP